jgi:hypothetical protein
MFLRGIHRKKDGKDHRYFSIVENHRTASDKTVQRTVLYLGEISDQQQAAWRKTLSVFDGEQQEHANLSLFPDDRQIPADAVDSLQVKMLSSTLFAIMITTLFANDSDPRDMREVYFWDPSEKTYIPIPYRDRQRPPTSRWEIQAAEKRLKAAGYARVDEVLIFQAIEEMRALEQESERKTKKARRAREMRDNPPRKPVTNLTEEPGGSSDKLEQDMDYEVPVTAFEGIVEPE